MRQPCRIVESPDESSLEGRTDAICVLDVVELLDSPRGTDLTNDGRLRTVLSTGTVAEGLDLADHCAPCAAGGCDNYTRFERVANAEDC
jgi:hypothetical protein